MIRLMIADDKDVVRNGLSHFLGNKHDIEVVAQAIHGLDMIAQLESGLLADVLLADVNMPEMDGLALATYLSLYFPDLRTIVLTMHNKEAFLVKAREAGACGFILKDNLGELPIAIRQVAAGGTYFPA